MLKLLKVYLEEDCNMYRYFVKRLLDIILSLIAIVILSPVLILTAIMVSVKMGNPVLFCQERIGKDAKIFKMYKYRSMTNELDEFGDFLSKEKRLTKFGKFIRSTSIDELPELFSILLGDMSFIGPRPLRSVDLPYFKLEERDIHTVSGGLIPPDVLSGRAITTYEEQFEYELYYARNVSLLLDIKIIFATFKVLLKRAKEDYGASERPHLKDYRKDLRGIENEIE
jgi:undecaprenyl phosphate N,N'-diacetylbacillosamine 1-phosphate transferase